MKGSEGVDSKMSLKMARHLSNLTQEEAAKNIGVSKDVISNYECAESYPSIPVLKRIEKVYGVNYNQLIFLPLDYDLTVEKNSGK